MDFISNHCFSPWTTSWDITYVFNIWLFESAAFSLQNINIPSQITAMVPYIVTIIALFIYSVNKEKNIKTKKKEENEKIKEI